jgi:hypothetical protein
VFNSRLTENFLSSSKRLYSSTNHIIHDLLYANNGEISEITDRVSDPMPKKED